MQVWREHCLPDVSLKTLNHVRGIQWLSAEGEIFLTCEALRVQTRCLQSSSEHLRLSAADLGRSYCFGNTAQAALSPPDRCISLPSQQLLLALLPQGRNQHEELDVCLITAAFRLRFYAFEWINVKKNKTPQTQSSQSLCVNLLEIGDWGASALTASDWLSWMLTEERRARRWVDSDGWEGPQGGGWEAVVEGVDGRVCQEETGAIIQRESSHS